MRVRAPELRGRRWLNTDGIPTAGLSLADLRGRVVLLDFWTFCCANCLHVIDELRPLEAKYRDSLVIIGVHSPKFEHERDPDAVEAAVERYGVTHPVLDDPDLVMWDQYAVRAWPTLVLIDPDGYVVSTMAGEGHGVALDRLIGELVTEKSTKLTDSAEELRVSSRSLHGRAVQTPLRFPGKVAALPGGTLLVSDSAHHSLVEMSPDGRVIERRIGSGLRGREDGPPESAQFNEPQGLLVLPAEIAARAGFDVLVADTVNHVLRSVRLSDGWVGTAIDLAAALQGTHVVTGPIPATLSPWDLAWWNGRVVVAAAGVHLLLSYELSYELDGPGTVEVLAGTTVEGLRDGRAVEGWLAQPSGLAADGDRLWFVDSETSALRWLDQDGLLHTAVGQGLFDFGHIDGPGADALFQHPLGVYAEPAGAVLVCDTYNGALRSYDREAGVVSTVATGLAEPSDVIVHNGRLIVVESAAHRLITPQLATSSGDARHRPGGGSTGRPVTELAPGEVTLDVMFTPAPGQHLDDRYGPALRLEVSAAPPDLLLDGSGIGAELTRTLRLAVGEGVLSVIAQAASCDDEDAAHAACHLTRQDWGVPIRVTPGGSSELALMLRGAAGLR